MVLTKRFDNVAAYRQITEFEAIEAIIHNFLEQIINITFGVLPITTNLDSVLPITTKLDLAYYQSP